LKVGDTAVGEFVSVDVGLTNGVFVRLEEGISVGRIVLTALFVGNVVGMAVGLDDGLIVVVGSVVGSVETPLDGAIDSVGFPVMSFVG
jgi:hypothetical protein